ncbi:MAG TPA: PQQ-dependent sugar dehydrogenase [Gemmatimonadales bacterium]|nr:PQQ-dependent sugar dehydrogenase [Gemmatimonadales bacterium]
MDFRFLGGRRFRAVALLMLASACAEGDAFNSGNTAPTAVITTPTAGTSFSGGQQISYSGAASDAEDGMLAADRLAWWVVLHHDTHTHPFMPRTEGVASGGFAIPTRGHTETNIWLRLYLEARDAEGLADTTWLDLEPRTVTLSFATAPPGLQLTVDGQPRTAPFNIPSIVGMERDVGAPSPQVAGSTAYAFKSWSNSQQAEYTVVTPPANAALVATFNDTTLANFPPTVSITAPSAGASLTKGVATAVAVGAADADGTVAKVEFFDGAALIGTDNSSPWSVNWSPATTGTHSLTAKATDNDGAVTTSAAVAVTVVTSGGGDAQPPSVQLSSPTDGTTGLSGSVAFSATASDNVGVTAVTFQVDGVTLSEDASAPYQATLPSTSPYATGVHVIRARARDAAGNVSSWASARVTFVGGALPAGFSKTTYVSGLSDLGTTMAWSPDGRLFIAQQSGALRVVKNGVLLSTPFVIVPTTAEGERGLLGVTFHPQFASNHWVYVYYTTTSGGTHNRIARYTASGDVASGTPTIIAELPALSATNHNGGALHFGPDGKLYVATGDNAVTDAPQSLTSAFGKILRFNDDGTIPSDNPFYASTTGIYRAIWARGLRNPFTFGFQPGGSRMFINDVGAQTWEEINEGQRGGNYGWRTYEGPSSAPGYISPLYYYGHSDNPSLVIGYSIVGAAFYPSTATLFPAAYRSSYYFGDYVNGWVNRLDLVNGNAVYAFADVNAPLTDVRIGPDGALYVLAQTGSTWGVFRIGH